MSGGEEVAATQHYVKTLNLQVQKLSHPLLLASKQSWLYLGISPIRPVLAPTPFARSLRGTTGARPGAVGKVRQELLVRPRASSHQRGPQGSAPARTHLGLPEDDVDVGGRALEHVGLGDDEEDVLGLADGDAGDAVDLPQPQLGHGLRGHRAMGRCTRASTPRTSCSHALWAVLSPAHARTAQVLQPDRAAGQQSLPQPWGLPSALVPRSDVSPGCLLLSPPSSRWPWHHSPKSS